MAIKTFNPTTPSRRNMTVLNYQGLSKVKPEKSLLEKVKKTAGRNSYGRITVRHIGGGNKKKYRIIDFKRQKLDVFAEVKTIEYDPNRSANIALIQYEDGEKAYILAPEGLKIGDKVISSKDADIKPGNCLPVENIPVGTMIHNIELYPGKGAQLVRSAGVGAQLMAKEGGKAMVRLGIRPTVRGSVMNPCDHPHGGGEGKSPIGRPSPVTPWGKPAMGYKTRKKNHRTDKQIARRRNGK